MLNLRYVSIAMEALATKKNQTKPIHEIKKKHVTLLAIKTAYIFTRSSLIKLMYFSRILIPSSKYLKDGNILYSLTFQVYVGLCLVVSHDRGAE